MSHPARSISRRSFLAAMVGGAAALAVSRRGVVAAPVPVPPQRNLAWVWNFDDDGPPDAMRSVLAQNFLGITLKSHDGTDWVGYRSDSPLAINGPDQVRAFATYFEQAGVPFHAWCVVRGEDPIAEAQICAQVLNSGARSMTFDLEPNDHGNFWQAGPAAAVAFGQELRKLAPDAWLRVAPDPRPWQILEVPMAEFAQFCNEIAPQAYWHDFDSPDNYRLLRDHGYDIGPDGMTPQAVLDISHRYLSPFGLPLSPAGQGAASRDDWEGFVRHASELKMGAVSVWRYGTADAAVWPLLRDSQPATPPVVSGSTPGQPSPPVTVTPSTSTSTSTIRPPQAITPQATNSPTQSNMPDTTQQSFDSDSLFTNPFRRATDPAATGSTSRTSASDLFSRAPDGGWRWPASR